MKVIKISGKHKYVADILVKRWVLPFVMLFVGVSILLAQPEDTSTLGVSMQLKPVPPESVLDLSASPVEEYGVIRLTWTAVATGYGSQLLDNPSYRLNLSKESLEDFSNDESEWWNYASLEKTIDISEANEPGDLEEIEVGGLQPNTTYYAGIKAHSDGKWSENLNVAEVRVLDIPAAPSDFKGVAQSSSAIQWSWTDNSDNEEGFEIWGHPDMRDEVMVDSTTLTAGTTGYLQAGLTANTSSHYYKIHAVGREGDSQPASADVFPVYTLANTPGEIEVAEVNVSSVTLKWVSASNPELTRYGIAYAEDEHFEIGHTTAAAWGGNITGTSYTVEGLQPDTEYYFRIWAYNENRVMTEYSDAVNALTHYRFISLDDIYVYPNPFKPGDRKYRSAQGGSGVVIENLPESAEIRVFNISGQLVDEFTHEGDSSIRWEKAEEVSTGVYLIVVNHDGDAETIKFAVVR